MKYVNTQHQPQLASELAEFFASTKTATWGEVMAFVSTKWEVKNWMGVRGALQVVLDSDTIVRVDDIDDERWSLS